MVSTTSRSCALPFLSPQNSISSHIPVLDDLISRYIRVEILPLFIRFLKPSDASALFCCSRFWRKINNQCGVPSLVASALKDPTTLREYKNLRAYEVEQRGVLKIFFASHVSNYQRSSRNDLTLEEIATHMPRLQTLTAGILTREKEDDFLQLTRLNRLHSLSLSIGPHLDQTPHAYNRLSILSTLSLLTSLTLKEEPISDHGLSHIGLLTQLRQLNLSKCDQFTNAGLSHLSNLKALEFLDLSTCTEVTDAGLPSLSKLASLQALSLSMIVDAGIGLLSLSTLSALHSLDLSFTNISDSAISRLSAFPSLHYLNLDGCEEGVTAVHLCHFTDFPALCALNLATCRFTDLTGLSALTRLQFLDISGSSNPDVLFRLPNLEALHSLRDLILFDLPITEESFLPLLSPLRGLRVTWNGGCMFMGDIKEYNG